MNTDKPLSVYFYEWSNSVIPWTDWLVIVKVISIVVVISIFYYHGLNSTTVEFRQKYPVLFSKLDLKYYNKVKWTFALVPFADIIFYILLFTHRYNTVSFLKAFAVKKQNNNSY